MLTGFIFRSLTKNTTAAVRQATPAISIIIAMIFAAFVSVTEGPERILYETSFIPSAGVKSGNSAPSFTYDFTPEFSAYAMLTENADSIRNMAKSNAVILFFIIFSFQTRLPARILKFTLLCRTS